MRWPRTLVATFAVLSLAVAGAWAQQPQDPLGKPLFPDFLASHASDGVAPDGARTRTELYVTNAGRLPLAAEIAFVSDAGFPASPFPVPAIAPGATLRVLLRSVVGAAAPPFVSGTVHVRFYRPDAPTSSTMAADGPPDPPMGVVAAYLTTIVPSAPGAPASPPQTIPLDVRPLHALAPCPHPPCGPSPCPADHPCPGPDLACVPAPGVQCELPVCPTDHPCPTPDHPCVPAPGAVCGPEACPAHHPCPTPDYPCVPPPGTICGPQMCPTDHPCPTPDHPCVPPPGTSCGSASTKGVRVIRAD